MLKKIKAIFVISGVLKSFYQIPLTWSTYYQGDCDSDAECSGDFICGTDNCIGFGDSTVDCCIDGLRHHVSEGTQYFM